MTLANEGTAVRHLRLAANASGTSMDNNAIQVTSGTNHVGFGNRWEIENVQACSPRCTVQQSTLLRSGHEGDYDPGSDKGKASYDPGSDGRFTATVHLDGKSASGSFVLDSGYGDESNCAACNGVRRRLRYYFWLV